MLEASKVTLAKTLIWSLTLVTLFVTPFWSLDPINPIKLLCLSSFGFVSLGIILTNKKSYWNSNYRIPIILLIGFISWQIIVVFASHGEIIQQLFGATGRNTGLLAYLSLSLLFMASVIVASEFFVGKFIIATVVIGAVSLAYGILQEFNLDPFDWVNPYSPVIGFLGNPNFQSSLLGILGSVVASQLLSSKLNKKLRVSCLIYILVTLYTIKQTHSQQGFLILLIGFATSLAFFVYFRFRKLVYPYFFVGALGFTFGLCGLFNKGPFSRILYDDSITFRGDYWRAGWNMTLEHPMFGVGLDSYGDWYRRSRSIEATLRRGPDITSNAAHNVFLDLSSYGGFPLALIYIVLTVIAIVSIIKVIQRSQKFDSNFVAIVSGWVAYQVQSIVSINQIGLAIWGWVLSGLIVGYELNTRVPAVNNEKTITKRSLNPIRTTPFTILGISIGFAVGVLAGLPPLLASVQYRSALETGDPEIIRQAAYIWPRNPSYMVQVAVTLNDNKYESDGLKVALDAISKFPDNYGVWVALNLMKGATEEQKNNALIQMKRLDPLNPNLK